MSRTPFCATKTVAQRGETTSEPAVERHVGQYARAIEKTRLVRNERAAPSRIARLETKAFPSPGGQMPRVFPNRPRSSLAARLGKAFVSLAMAIRKRALLFIAATTRFLDGPRVLATGARPLVSDAVRHVEPTVFVAPERPFCSWVAARAGRRAWNPPVS